MRHLEMVSTPRGGNFDIMSLLDAVISSIIIGAATAQQFGLHESPLLRIGKHRLDSDREQLVMAVALSAASRL